MEVDGAVAAVAWAVTFWKLPAVRRNRSRDQRVPRIWLFTLLFAGSMTFQIDAVYAAVDTFTGVNNLAWLVAYVLVALAFYFFATASHMTTKAQPPLDKPRTPPRWMPLCLMATLGLLTAIFPLGIAASPEWTAHDIPRSLADLAFMETLYVFAVVMCFTPTLTFVRLFQGEEVLPTRIRAGTNLLALVLVLAILVAKSAVALLGYLVPLSPFAPHLATLARALLVFAGLVWSLAFAPQRLFLALARPLIFWQKVRTLRDLKRLQAQLASLCPPVASAPAGRWAQLKDLDFHIYRAIIDILDCQQILAGQLEGSVGAWNSPITHEAQALYRALQDVAGDAEYEEVVKAYGKVGRMLRHGPIPEAASPPNSGPWREAAL